MVYDILLGLLPTHRESLLSTDLCKLAVEEPYLGIVLDSEKEGHCCGMTPNCSALFFSECKLNPADARGTKETGSLERLGVN